jgi:hypothetical protein
VKGALKPQARGEIMNEFWTNFVRSDYYRFSFPDSLKIQEKIIHFFWETKKEPGRTQLLGVS